MSPARLVRLCVVYGLFVLSAYLVVACHARSDGSGGSAASGDASYLGVYKLDSDPQKSIEIKTDHKVILSDEHGPTQATWQVSGPDKITITGGLGAMELLHNSDGSLRGTLDAEIWKKQ